MSFVYFLFVIFFVNLIIFNWKIVDENICIVLFSVLELIYKWFKSKVFLFWK